VPGPIETERLDSLTSFIEYSKDWMVLFFLGGSSNLEALTTLSSDFFLGGDYFPSHSSNFFLIAVELRLRWYCLFFFDESIMTMFSFGYSTNFI